MVISHCSFSAFYLFFPCYFLVSLHHLSYLFPIKQPDTLRRSPLAHFLCNDAAIVPLACSERDTAARMLRQQPLEPPPTLLSHPLHELIAPAHQLGLIPYLWDSIGIVELCTLLIFYSVEM
jgi:hypothetical protein